MKISVIMPTYGRPTLERAVKSVMHQLLPGDELIVIVDGEHKLLGDIEERLMPLRTPDISGALMYNLRVLCTYQPTMKHNGAEQRDLGIESAWGTNLMFLDDDDIYVRNALDTVRRVVGNARGLPHIFKMRAGTVTNFHGELWRNEWIGVGNVGTPMLFVPRVPDLPKWGPYDSGAHDYFFINEIVNNIYAGHVVWRPEVLSIIRPTEAQASTEIP
jgi:hypothetical protein